VLRLWLWLVLGVVGCLEQVTGEPTPLDPRFIEVATADDTGGPGHASVEHTEMEHKSDDTGGPSHEDVEHVDVASPQPFEDFEGEKVLVSGTVVALLSGAVELDVSRIDKDFPGGRESQGKLLFDEAGAFELQVPKGIGSLCLVAFQDPDQDGPGDGDFYAEITIDVGDEPVMDLVLILSTETRENRDTGGPLHAEVGPPQPFADVEGEKVLVSGTVVAVLSGAVELDVSRVDEEFPGGRESKGKLLFDDAGDFELQVPKGVGPLCLVAFQDPDLDGPGEGDFYAEITIDVGDDPVVGLVLTLSTEARSNAGGGPAHTEVGPPQPFEDVEGEKVLVSGTVVATVPGAVDIDVSRVDPEAPGGRESHGKMLFEAAGDFELQVPKGLGQLSLVAFQDPDLDGPGEGDFYAEMTIEVADEPVTGLLFTLSKEARSNAGGGPVHTEAPPGFGSDEGPQQDGKQSTKDPFSGMEGERVSVHGTVVFDGDAVVDLDLFQPDASVPGGRTLLGKLKISSGPFTLQVPRSLGALELDAFADKTGDGPSADDPRGQVSGIDLTAGDVSGVQLILEALTEEAPAAPPEGGGTDLEEEFARIGAGGGETTPETEGL
jgi:hypothetical protein